MAHIACCKVNCETYILDVASLVPSDALLRRLSPQRQEKVLAFKHEGGRLLSLGAGLLLDHALQRHGLRERELHYTHGPHGKPEADAPLHFNLSHSGSMAACAIAPCPVGVDIERTSRRIGEALLRRVCSPGEIARVRLDPAAFFDLWTAKEAVLKMTGEGINGDLRALDLGAVTTWRLPQGYALSTCCAAACLPPITVQADSLQG